MCIWKVEGDVLDFGDNALNIIYRNNSVEQFLEAEHSTGLAAPKGMGKTFLVKAKRVQLQKLAKGLLLLPRDKMVDVPGPIYLKNSHLTLLTDYNNWVSIWISCIAIYLLSLEEFRKEILVNEELKDLSDISKLLIASKNYSGICHVLNKLLNLDSKAKLKSVVDDSGLLFHYINRINHPVYIFIDKIEEPFNRIIYNETLGSSKSSRGPSEPLIWKYSQIALAEAVYKIYSVRHHIKVFYTIRQEALSNIENITQEYSKILSRIVILNYTHEDLYKLFALYIEHENNEYLLEPDLKEYPEKAFIGIDTLPHYSGGIEQVWDYICRHSLNRPRDIMEICLTLYNEIILTNKSKPYCIDDISSEIRHHVNRVSTQICSGYIATLEPFWVDKYNESIAEKIYKATRFLSTNVFAREYMQTICMSANENDCTLADCPSCDCAHIFSALYDVGLLGVIYKNGVDKCCKTSIKNIGESNFASRKQLLKQGILYYTHSGLSNLIEKEREAVIKPYSPNKLFVARDNAYLSESKFNKIEEHYRAIEGNEYKDRVFLTSTARDAKLLREVAKSLLSDLGYEVMAFEQPGFPSVSPETADTHDHCIDAMLKCRHVIYLVTGRFGGEYKGKKYRWHIKQNDTINNFSPSVSFMEYFVAKSHEKNVRVYMSEEIDTARGEWIENNKRKSYRSKVVEDNRVFEIIGYFNALNNGTWVDKYPNIEGLKEFIRCHFPKIKGGVK